MAEIDTSSYPKSLPAASPLDIASKLGSLEQQKLAIDQAKLNQANQALGFMTRAMGSIGPNATKEQYVDVAQNAVKMGLVPPQMLNTFVDRVNKAPNGATFYKEFMTAAKDHEQQLQMHTGINTTAQDNKNLYSGKTDILTGSFNPATKMPVQIAPGTPGFDPQNQQVYEQPEGPSGPVPTASPVGVPLPRSRPSLPAERPISGPTGPTREITADTPTSVSNRLEPLKAGPSVMFPEGKEAYTKDQLSASGRGMAIKPAIQALKLMPGLSTGPGTAQWNDLVAAAKAWGIVDTNAEKDSTVMRQELEKKLAQYVGSSPIGQRSDAQQALAEAGSPNPKKQILPALQNLTRDAVALDRVNILMPNAFKGNDYQNYIKHKGSFPQSIDEKALTLDLMPDSEREAHIKKMANQYKNGNATQKKEAERFLNTLKLAQEAKIYELN